ELLDVDRLVAADVVGTAGSALEQNGQEPRHQVRGVEIGAEGRAVAGDPDGSMSKRIADEVSDREVLAAGRARSDEGDTARDLEREVVPQLVEAQRFRLLLRAGVDRLSIRGCGGPEVFGDMAQRGRLTTVDRARADEQEAAQRLFRRDSEDAARAVD